MDAVDVFDGVGASDGLALLETASDDLAVAVDEAVAVGDASTAADLVVALTHLWQHRGLHLRQPSLVDAVEAMGDDIPPARAAELRAWRAFVATQQLVDHDPEVCDGLEGELLAAVETARSVGDPGARVRTLSLLMLAARGLGVSDSIVDAAGEALDLAGELGSEPCLGRVEAWAGMVALQRDDRPMAVLRGRRALARGRRIGDDFVIIRATLLLSPLALMGEIPPDEAPAAEALDSAIATGATWAQGLLYPAAAMEALVAGAPRRAAEFCLGGLSLASETNSMTLAIAPMLCIASISVVVDQPEVVPEVHGALPGQLETLRRSLSPEHLAGVERTVIAARQALGDDEYERIERRASRLPRNHIIPHMGAIAERLAGRTVADPATTAAPPIEPVETLTGREREVVGLLAHGATNKEIAVALQLQVKTVMHHTSSIYRKLGVRGRVEAAAWAWRNGVHADESV